MPTDARLTVVSASNTSPTFPPVPHLPASHLHNPPPCPNVALPPGPSGNTYSSAGRSFTRVCCDSSLGSDTSDRSVSWHFVTVAVNCVSSFGRLSERVRRAERVPVWYVSYGSWRDGLREGGSWYSLPPLLGWKVSPVTGLIWRLSPNDPPSALGSPNLQQVRPGAPAVPLRA